MKRTALVLALIAAAPAGAQLLPALPPQIGALSERVLGTVDRVVDTAPETLAQVRLDRIADLVRSSRGAVVRDDRGDAARAGEVVLTDPGEAVLAALQRDGFRLIERTEVEGLGVGYARLAVPVGVRLDRALARARRIAPEVAADVIHFESGDAAAPAGAAPVTSAAAGPVVGMIDGGVADPDVRQQGFAAGAPRASDHGSAVAWLIGRGAPGARVVAADVYGRDPAGGGAVAIARAIGWLAKGGVGTVSISLVGPPNPLLARVVAAAQRRGMTIVAAVGNDGPAAPPAYPASYPGVIAVTGVDARGRVLIEAGRAAHLDYAAPAAGFRAPNARGRMRVVRGTSFAAPLVAARLAAIGRARVDVEAVKGRGYGRGLVCGACVTRR
ncbi:peptidase S8 [Sphingomonas spermidinifaciens]|uniref:Peptidase S8 n=1 Tax=Sphingomonas spermidinifaciens TaxID=1141889 RepID=A0A2A4B842_9SPHN|nr:S8 family serine peptidase [Sphingomonas spermidinifaciens]PCD03959.1 peptidase S8 [Sphingomonas spermidinifaciens]